MGSKCVAGQSKTSLLLTLCLCLASAVGCQSDRPHDEPRALADKAGSHKPPERHRSHGKGSNSLDDEDDTSDVLATFISDTTFDVADIISVVIDAYSQAVQRFSGNASQAVRLLEDPVSADNRRTGMNRLVELGFLSQATPAEKQTAETFEKRCREIAEFDTDFTVRAAAIRTENRARDARATAIFVKNLNDKNELVRLEAAKALANIPDPAASPALVALMTDREESRDVRIAAADALKHYGTLPVERALSSMLHDRSFAVAWQARRSLAHLTSRDFRYDEAAWLSYFTANGKAM